MYCCYEPHQRCCNMKVEHGDSLRARMCKVLMFLLLYALAYAHISTLQSYNDCRYSYATRYEDWGCEVIRHVWHNHLGNNGRHLSVYCVCWLSDVIIASPWWVNVMLYSMFFFSTEFVIQLTLVCWDWIIINVVNCIFYPGWYYSATFRLYFSIHIMCTECYVCHSTVPLCIKTMWLLIVLWVKFAVCIPQTIAPEFCINRFFLPGFAIQP